MLEETQHLAEQIRQLITLWRERFSHLSSAEQERVAGSLDDLRAPCQVTVFWIRNASFEVDQQLWVISHFESDPDLDISVHGPLGTDRVLSELGVGLDDEKFSRALPDPSPYLRIETYRPIVESQLLRLVERVRSNVIRSLWGQSGRQSGIIEKQRLSESAFTWILLEDALSLDLDAIVEGMVTHLHVRANVQPPAKPANTETLREAPLEGFGTYLYPQVWIGERPAFSFEERLSGVMHGSDPIPASFRYRDAVFFERFGEFYVIARQNGYLAVTIPDRHQALEAINIFMSLATLRGIQALAVRDAELDSITADAESGLILRSSGAMILPRMAPAHFSYTSAGFELELRQPLEIPTLRQLWEETESISRHRPTASLINLFGQIYTRYQNEEYTEAVIFASIWVEQISEIAVSAGSLENDGVPQHRRRRGGLFDALRLLTEIEEADPLIEKNLRDLMRARSQALHGNEGTTKEQAESALLVVTHLIKALPRLVGGS